MEKQRLLQTLEQLRQELLQAERVDDETLADLESLTSDVRRELDKRDARSTSDVAPVSGLKNLLLKYEADHPQLSTAVGRVADALAAMGF